MLDRLSIAFMAPEQSAIAIACATNRKMVQNLRCHREALGCPGCADPALVPHRYGCGSISADPSSEDTEPSIWRAPTRNEGVNDSQWVLRNGRRIESRVGTPGLSHLR